MKSENVVLPVAIASGLRGWIKNSWPESLCKDTIRNWLNLHLHSESLCWKSICVSCGWCLCVVVLPFFHFQTWEMFCCRKPWLIPGICCSKYNRLFRGIWRSQDCYLARFLPVVEKRFSTTAVENTTNTQHKLPIAKMISSLRPTLHSQQKPKQKYVELFLVRQNKISNTSETAFLHSNNILSALVQLFLNYHTCSTKD